MPPALSTRMLAYLLCPPRALSRLRSPAAATESALEVEMEAIPPPSMRRNGTNLPKPPEPFPSPSPERDRETRLLPCTFCTPAHLVPKSRNRTTRLQIPCSHSEPPTAGTRTGPAPTSALERVVTPIVTSTAAFCTAATFAKLVEREARTAYRRPASHFDVSVDEVALLLEVEVVRWRG